MNLGLSGYESTKFNYSFWIHSLGHTFSINILVIYSFPYGSFDKVNYEMNVTNTVLPSAEEDDTDKSPFL
jgi:hypothetical protein